ncbi:15974_t:CDS:2 [Funneliformis mosseae]|uniref:15974_t:CDS:1 n=1 Tax=Funneliformis mosseae TaxID=27381 RepID=A0A9N9FCJ2_FUNMO|nr:15974_t:CDS:2 [Funneliformis mosseae]
MKSITFALIIAFLVTFIYSSPLPQGNGEQKSVNIVGPGPGPLTIGSEQTITWTTTGFSADEPISFAILAEHNLAPPFIADKFTPGTKYGSFIALESEPTNPFRGPIFEVTDGGNTTVTKPESTTPSVKADFL